MQKEADPVVHSALTQFTGERQQMVIMDPQRIVWLDQRQKLVGQHRVDPQISLPGFALEADQVKTIVEGRPQHGVGKLVVIFIMVPFIQVERRPGDISAGDLLQRLLVIANFAAPAKPQTPRRFQCPQDADGQTASARFFIVR